ncbi:GL26555 [Drosophila persimilis]|uniref:Phosphatidylinositol-glycan biosynthesis class W protein n=1 Tax=Drosophila persimilis TaxID=7234 RepID=B4GSK4_DROPE|nr:GL26555 [Drosophila persimilis]
MEQYLSVDQEVSVLNKKSWNSIIESVDSLITTLPVMIGFVLSRMLCGHLPRLSTRRFLLEYMLVAIPAVIVFTVGSDFFHMYSIVSFLALVWYLRPRRELELRNTKYEVGKRPLVFTLLRAICNCGTSVAILMVDFPVFPVRFRKSRTFGASAMDMGIGIFVVTMGLVSHRARNLTDLKKLPRAVVPLLLLGLGRTTVISMINYNHDVHEYGIHMNAFFILGLTKLFGSLCSLLANSDLQLLGLAMGILSMHELVLQLGLCDYVMSDTVPRLGFLSSNREGLSSLPGCVALYPVQHLLRQVLKRVLLIAVVLWVMVILSAFLSGIARVTFNFGYVIWILFISVVIILNCAFFFELAFVQTRPTFGDCHKETANSLPTFVESLNMNGLSYFLLSNFFTGMVNIFFDPNNRSNSESVLILLAYVLICSMMVFIMHKKRIRIA